KITVPVGLGTDAVVLGSRCTNTSSCTTVPDTTSVTAAPAALKMVVDGVAFAQRLVASALSPAFASPVVRVSTTPPTVTVVVALTVVVPDSDELMTTVHEPVAPDVVQVFGPTKAAAAPPEFVRLKVISVPAGAFAKPEPAFTFTCPVSVWLVETGLIAV